MEMLETCWKNAGKMLDKCWKNVGKMMENDWKMVQVKWGEGCSGEDESEGLLSERKQM